jgi:hypothetical protein
MHKLIAVTALSLTLAGCAAPAREVRYVTIDGVLMKIDRDGLIWDVPIGGSSEPTVQHAPPSRVPITWCVHSYRTTVCF